MYCVSYTRAHPMASIYLDWNRSAVLSFFFFLFRSVHRLARIFILSFSLSPCLSFDLMGCVETAEVCQSVGLLAHQLVTSRQRDHSTGRFTPAHIRPGFLIHSVAVGCQYRSDDDDQDDIAHSNNDDDDDDHHHNNNNSRIEDYHRGSDYDDDGHAQHEPRARFVEARSTPI